MPFVFLLLPDLAEALIVSYSDHKSLLAMGESCKTMVVHVRKNYITALKLPYHRVVDRTWGQKKEKETSCPRATHRHLLRVSSLLRGLKRLRRVNVGCNSLEIPGLVHAIKEGSCKGLREIEHERSDPLYGAMASDPLGLLPNLQVLFLKDGITPKFAWVEEEEDEDQQQQNDGNGDGDGDGIGGDEYGAAPITQQQQGAFLSTGANGDVLTSNSTSSSSNTSLLPPLHQLFQALGDGGFPHLRSLRINLGDDINWVHLLQALQRVNERCATPAIAGFDDGGVLASSSISPVYLNALTSYFGNQHFSALFALDACARITSLEVDELEQEGLDALAAYLLRRFEGHVPMDVDVSATINNITASNTDIVVSPPFKRMTLNGDDYRPPISIHFLPALFSPGHTGAYLEELQLVDIGFPPEQLAAAFRQEGFGRNLRCLFLKHCGGTASEAGYGLDADFASQAIPALMSQPHGFPVLTVLQLVGDGNAGSPAVAELAQGLCQQGMMPVLRGLSLSRLYMGDQGLMALADAFQRGAPCGASIHWLDLSDNDLGQPTSPSTGVTALAQCLASGFLPQLNSVELRGNGARSSSSKEGGINDRNVQQLVEAFRAGAGQPLRYLGLDGANLTAASVFSFERALCHGEICPSLKYCPFGFFGNSFYVPAWQKEATESIGRIEAFLEDRKAEKK